MGIAFPAKRLVDLTGRAIREDKCGYIDSNQATILERLEIISREWMVLTTQFESKFKSLVGCEEKLFSAAKALNLRRRPGLSDCEALFH